MKPVMIVLVAVFAAVIAGAGVAFFVLKSSGGGETKHAEAAELPVHNLALDERTVNLADTGETRYLRLSVVLEAVGGGDIVKLAEERKPQLLDCLIEISSKHTFKSLVDPEGKAKLKEELLAAFNEKVTDNGWTVRDVLFTDFIME